MATISKVTLPSGTVRWRASLKAGGRRVASKNFSSKTAARVWVQRLEGDRELMAALGSPGGAKTFVDAANAMLKGTQSRDPARAARVGWWVERIGHLPLGRIEVGDLRGHLDNYAEDHKPASSNRLKAAVSSVFRHALREGWWTRNPARQLAHRTEDNQVVRWLSDDERARLLTACETSTWPKLKALVLVLLGTGCRLGEALGLRWDDIDWSARTALLGRTKNNEPRILTFPEPVLAELRKHRQVGAGLVFAGTDPAKPFTFRKAWLRALHEAGIENLRVHDLRHTAASYLVMNGASLHEAAAVLGHKSVQTTRRYAHLSVEHVQALIDRVLGAKLS